MEAQEITKSSLLKTIFVIIVFFGIIMLIFSIDLIFYKNRDMKRRADIMTISKALDIYYNDYGSYPDSSDDWEGWDISYGYNKTPDFLHVLVEQGYVKREVLDPVNDQVYHYRYKKYPAGSWGCQKPFYILQVFNFEMPSEDIGMGMCPRLDWTAMAPNGYTMQRFN